MEGVDVVIFKFQYLLIPYFKKHRDQAYKITSVPVVFPTKYLGKMSK